MFASKILKVGNLTVSVDGTKILADNGYYSAQAVTGVEDDGEGPTSTPRSNAITTVAAWPI